MLSTTRGVTRTLALLLLATVATQIFYVAVVMESGDDTPLRAATWLVELFAFSGIAITGLVLAICDARQAGGWSLVAFSGLLNILQVSMGLSMFGPALEARETVPELFATVLAGAFSLYFIAKLLLGCAAIGFGTRAVREGSGLPRAFGALALLAGIAAVVICTLAMIDSKAWLFPAGVAGTAVAALFALALLTATDS